MSKVQRTYSQLFELNIAIGGYMKRNEDVENALTKGIEKFSKQLKSVFQDYNDRVDIFQLKRCYKHEKTKTVIRDEFGNRQFTEDGETRLKEDIEKLNEEEVDIKPVIIDGVEELVSKLKSIEKEFFSGILIPDQSAESVDENKEESPESVNETHD